MEITRDGQSRRIGSAREVDWIAGRTRPGWSVTAVVPPVFEAYGTFHQPGGCTVAAHEQAVVAEDEAGSLPDLFFPADRSWLVSALWDDTWTCVGGPTALVDALRRNPLANARRVDPDEDALPPGLIRE